MSDGRTPNPLVTVVVAVLNGEPFLARALRSILAQDYSPLEILVVDGRSTDRTEAIARSFPGVRFLVQCASACKHRFVPAAICHHGFFI